MLSAPSPRRERILSIGAWGTWKTSSWLSIAQLSQATGSPAQFYVIDTDMATEAFIGQGQYADLSNVHVYDVFTWDEYRAAADDMRRKIQPDDWQVIDFISPSWDAVQDDYIENIYKTGSAEYYMEYRKARDSGQPLDGWKDWGVINRNYRDWQNRVLHMKCHKYWTAKPAAVGDKDDAALRATYGALGVKPKGQKELGHLPHTVLLHQQIKPGEVLLSTIKDRERPVLELAPMSTFALTYLVGVAGWSL